MVQIDYQFAVAILAQAIHAQTPHCLRVIWFVVSVLRPCQTDFHGPQGVECDGDPVRWMGESVARSLSSFRAVASGEEDSTEDGARETSWLVATQVSPSLSSPAAAQAPPSLPSDSPADVATNSIPLAIIVQRGVCREAGARVSTNVIDLDLLAPRALDGRRLEVVTVWEHAVRHRCHTGEPSPL